MTWEKLSELLLAKIEESSSFFLLKDGNWKFKIENKVGVADVALTLGIDCCGPTGLVGVASDSLIIDCGSRTFADITSGLSYSDGDISTANTEKGKNTLGEIVKKRDKILHMCDKDKGYEKFITFEDFGKATFSLKRN
jgi:hypothetical protein